MTQIGEEEEEIVIERLPKEEPIIIPQSEPVLVPVGPEK